MKYTEVKIELDKRILDDVLAELSAAGFDGVMIDDPEDVQDILEHPDTYRYDYINEEIVQDMKRRPMITLFFADDEAGRADLERACRAAEAAANILCACSTELASEQQTGPDECGIAAKCVENAAYEPLRFTVGSPKDDSEWLYKWQEHFKPTKVGERIVVKPSWEEYAPADSELVIEMDPGMAFGSGLHETTSMCIKALEKALAAGYAKTQCPEQLKEASGTGKFRSSLRQADADNSRDCYTGTDPGNGQSNAGKRYSECVKVLDVGTGTGILAIAAALLGADECLGIDIDEDAVSVALENISHNGLSDQITAQYGDLTEGVEYEADIVVANLMADLVIRLTPAVKHHLKKGGLYITSGILDIKEEVCRQAIEGAGFEVLEVLQDGEWRAIVARN